MPVAKDDARLAKCGFAKLQGEGVEYYVKKYEVTLGRRSKSTQLDIVLGDNMNISRKHACIRFNFDKGIFELVVIGKNGVTVGRMLHTPASPPLELRSQDFIQMGDKSFYFLLPKDVSRLGPPPAKQRRITTDHQYVSRAVPVLANGASDFDVPSSLKSEKLASESLSNAVPREKKRKSSLPHSSKMIDDSKERSEAEFCDMGPVSGVDELVVSGTGMKSGENGGDKMSQKKAPETD